MVRQFAKRTGWVILTDIQVVVELPVLLYRSDHVVSVGSEVASQRSGCKTVTNYSRW